MNYCEFPNGRMEMPDGSLDNIACDNPACTRIGGHWFCAAHAGMVERGCLDLEYTDGTTIRGAMDENQQ